MEEARVGSWLRGSGGGLDGAINNTVTSVAKDGDELECTVINERSEGWWARGAIEYREEKKKENGEPEPRRKEREVDLGRSKQ